MTEQETTRILVVDSDRDVREGLERLLTTCAPLEWEFEFAAPGREALVALRAGPFHAVVSDLSEPASSETEVLRVAARERPEALRVVLSGHAGVDAFVRSAPIAHRFLTKPTEATQLVETLQKSFALRQVVNNPRARALGGDVRTLPLRPKVFSQISEIMAQEDWGLSDISEAVSSEPALAAKILQIANSAAFSGSRPIGSLREAANRLGAQVIRDVTLCAEAFASFRGVPATLLDQIANEAVRVAQIASQLSSEEETRMLARTAGLLHDVGQVVRVWRKPKSALQIRTFQKKRSLNQQAAQRAILGTTDAELGAYLLGQWGLPLQVVEAVLLHREPPPSSEAELVWVVSAAQAALATRRAEPETGPEAFEQAGRLPLYERACQLAETQAKEAVSA